MEGRERLEIRNRIGIMMEKKEEKTENGLSSNRRITRLLVRPSLGFTNLLLVSYLGNSSTYVPSRY